MELDRILRMRDVLDCTGLSKSTLYRIIRDGEFPKPVRITSQLVGWRASVIQEWIESREPVSSPTWAGLDEPPEVWAEERGGPTEGDL